MAKIIVVDDSKSILCYIQEILEDDKHTVKTSETVFIAPIIVSMRPDLILMDVKISSISRGDAAAKALQRLTVVKEHTKIILHSSLSAPELEKLVHSCGADGYICKTSDPEKFKSQISHFLSQEKRTPNKI